MRVRRYAATSVYVVSVITAAIVIALGWLEPNIAMLGVLILMFGICCLGKP